MRIGTYNVQGFRGYPPPQAEKDLGAGLTERRIEHYQQVLAELDCDILALQEGVPHTVAQWIARSLDQWMATIPSPVAWNGHVFSRYPILESRILSHTAPNGESRPFSRCAGSVLIQLPNKELLRVLNVHLHPSNSALREQEAELIGEELPSYLSTANHTVVLGDFNCELGKLDNPDEPVHELLHRFDLVNVLIRTGDVPNTFFTRDEAKAIDHLYVTPSLAARLQRVEIWDRPGYALPRSPDHSWVHSDHVPVIAEFEMEA